MPEHRTPVNAPLDGINDALVLFVVRSPIVGDWQREQVRENSRRLTPIQRTVLTRRFGLDGTPPMTYRAIGGALGRSVERARQIVEGARRELSRHLFEFVGSDLVPRTVPRPAP